MLFFFVSKTVQLLTSQTVHFVISGFCHGMNEIIVLGQYTALNSSKCCALN